jgi:hypothetical protein
MCTFLFFGFGSACRCLPAFVPEPKLHHNKHTDSFARRRFPTFLRISFARKHQPEAAAAAAEKKLVQSELAIR